MSAHSGSFSFLTILAIIAAKQESVSALLHNCLNTFSHSKGVNPNVPTRVVIYHTGIFYVISISFWLRKIKDPGSGILHWPV